MSWKEWFGTQKDIIPVARWRQQSAAVQRVLALVERKGIPFHLIGGSEKKPKKVRRERESELPMRRGLPD